MKGPIDSKTAISFLYINSNLADIDDVMKHVCFMNALYPKIAFTFIVR